MKEPQLLVWSFDIKYDPSRKREVSLLRGDDFLTLQLDETTARVPRQDWFRLETQIAERALSKWQFGQNVPSPLGLPEMRNLVRMIDSTASYQLFLACIEISTFLRIVDEPQHIIDRFGVLSGILVRLGGRNGLFFPPSEMLKESSQILDELVLNNRLGRLQVRTDENRETFFVPYVTPVAFKVPVSAEARQLWERIRNAHFERRRIG